VIFEQLVQLPREPNVNKILDDYLKTLPPEEEDATATATEGSRYECERERGKSNPFSFPPPWLVHARRHPKAGESEGEVLDRARPPCRPIATAMAGLQGGPRAAQDQTTILYSFLPQRAMEA
jgi:hypothetical protein